METDSLVKRYRSMLTIGSPSSVGRESLFDGADYRKSGSVEQFELETGRDGHPNFRQSENADRLKFGGKVTDDAN
jgi:hypothetical protein